MMIGPEWIVRSAVSIVLLGCMSVASKLSAQSTLGVTGLLNSPSAEMAADGTVRVGANFLNDRLTPATFDYHTFNYYLNVTFLPFLEVALTSTAFMNERRTAFVNEDRSVSVRVRLLGERRVRPAIAESTEPDTVTRTVVRAQPLAVFFTIGQTNITDKEMVNLKYAAQVIKDSPGHVYKITGYADTQTGTPQRNEYLSNQRAQNVYDALVNKFGVSPKSLKIVPRKGQSVPFDNAVLDRVSIVE